MFPGATITRAGIEDAPLLGELGARTFMEAHAASAPKHELDAYIRERYSREALIKALQEPENIYHLLRYENRVVGYSKMLLDKACAANDVAGMSKLEQLYLLQEMTGLRLGAKLLAFNTDLSHSRGQHGIWLEVWTGNNGAIAFYEHFGFKIIAEGIFPLTATHTNPHYVMCLRY